MSRTHDGERNRPFKRGVVKEVDAATARVKVTFADEDGNESHWLQVGQPAAGGNKVYMMPDVGSQVHCLLDWDGEDGVVLSAAYSEADPPPTSDGDSIHIKTSGGLEIIVGKGSSNVTIRNANDVHVEANGEIRLKAPKVVLEADEVHLGGEGGQQVHRKGDLDSGGDAAEGSATKVYAV